MPSFLLSFLGLVANAGLQLLGSQSSYLRVKAASTTAHAAALQSLPVIDTVQFHLVKASFPFPLSPLHSAEQFSKSSGPYLILQPEFTVRQTRNKATLVLLLCLGNS